MIHAESLAAVIGEFRIQDSKFNSEHGETLRSPGRLRRHYSPKARLLVLNWCNDTDLYSQLSTLNPQLLDCHVIAHTHIPLAEHFARVSVIPHDAEAFARAIYAELHHCDAAGAGLIVVEMPPESPEWSGIADRLRRASA
jgi:L-threonylcarbamoyladenylate synthase